MRERQITAVQAAAVLVSSLIGISVLALPRITAERVNYGAPLATLVGLAITAAGLVAITFLGTRFPRDSIIEYARKLIGRPLGDTLGFLYVSFIAVLLSLAVREFADMMNTIVLSTTPFAAIIAAVLIAVGLTSRSDVTTFAYIQFYYAPLTAAAMLLLIALSATEMKLVNLLPVWGNGTHIGDFWSAGVLVASMPFAQIGMCILTVVIPSMADPRQAFKGMTAGLIVSSLLVVLTVAATMAVMSAEEAANDVWPAMALTRMMQLPAQILERIDLLYLMVWVGTALTTFLSGYYLICCLASRLFGLRSHRTAAMPLIPVLFALALAPRNTLHTYSLIQLVGVGGLGLTVGFPILLALLSAWRGKGRSAA
ncbi:GerAB/ArcD/ProY family transporter [Paenibacillus sp.]|uniref:GerAB/ArcD/ProY family transporter n=1 Tax=Paenibacillus sp. TaxID=58172 RepID=UPI002D605EDE|nr:GerAB/ArcD/ProY family transporter [Paenibacillus sp.]HZG85143.1 GerAB/ArcD/ProY family transporter [Paenibacillus sp.]